MAIEFYRERDLPYGCFSNFSKHSFVINGQTWQTVEHYFQAQKFPGTPQEEAIRLAPDPLTAKHLGNLRAFPLGWEHDNPGGPPFGQPEGRGFPIRADWETVKDSVMRDAVRAKFTQHEDIRAVLLSTGDETLIEAARNDAYWGYGPDGKGQNKLGLTLMDIRDELR